MYTIEQLIPHRGRMKLVQELIKTGDDRCMTVSVALPEWPLCADGAINPIVLIELVAQTAGVNIGLHEIHKDNPSGKTGWLVGIKKAEFFRSEIPVHSKIYITVMERTRDDAYAEIVGMARIESELIAEMELQVYRPVE